MSPATRVFGSGFNSGFSSGSQTLNQIKLSQSVPILGKEDSFKRWKANPSENKRKHRLWQINASQSDRQKGTTIAENIKTNH